MNSEHINAQHQTKRGKETFLSFYLPVACNSLFDGARFLTRAFYINRLSAHAVKRAPSKALKIKARNRQSHTEVEFPRSVQLVARNRQLRTEVEFPRSVQLVARNRKSRAEVEFPCSV